MRNPLITAVAALMLTTTLHVKAENDQQRLASELVKLIDYPAMFGEAIKQCSSPSSYKADAIAMFQADPRVFRGVSPQSKYWPDAEAVFAKYRNTMCQYLSPQEFAGFMAKQYVSRMTADELKAAMAFFSSPAGRKYQQASLAGSNELQAYAQKRMQELQRKAYETVTVDLDALGERYRREPK